jgi:hypothetical protein
MRAILIDAAKREVTEVEIPGDLKSLQAAVGGYIETAVRLADEDVIFVNEEGLLQSPPTDHWFVFKGAHQPFAGNGILVGGNDDGETVAAKAPLDAIKRKVEFLTLEDVRVLAKLM